MRRPAPRTLADALTGVVERAAPATALARVQAAWPEIAGAAIAREARPVAERSGTLTIECRSSVWAAELELLAPDLLRRLNEALATPGAPMLTVVRVRTAHPA